jgi:hypothetical protein
MIGDKSTEASLTLSEAMRVFEVPRAIRIYVDYFSADDSRTDGAADEYGAVIKLITGDGSTTTSIDIPLIAESLGNRPSRGADRTLRLWNWAGRGGGSW